MLFIMLIKLCFVKNSPPPPDAERETAFPVFIKRRFVHTETAWTVCVKRRGLQSLRGGGGVPACHRPAAVRGVRRSGRGIPVPPGSLRSPRRANLRCIVSRAFPTLCVLRASSFGTEEIFGVECPPAFGFEIVVDDERVFRPWRIRAVETMFVSGERSYGVTDASVLLGIIKTDVS